MTAFIAISPPPWVVCSVRSPRPGAIAMVRGIDLRAQGSGNPGANNARAPQINRPSSDSSMIVTGPWLTEDTSIKAPNTPCAKGTPLSSM